MAQSPKPSPLSADAQAAMSKVVRDGIFAGIMKEVNINEDQLKRRQALIIKIEEALSKKYNADNKLISYIIRFDHRRAMISSADVVALDSILSSIKHAEQLNVVLHGPGGDGTIVEKMVEMCRDHLPRHSQKLRVIVPNIAKSAATVFALGADTIVMGYCSELGPIDPQVPVVNAGIPQLISAWAFVESRDNLMNKIAEATRNKEPTAGFITQLSGLNTAFVQEMENQISFARDTAKKLLSKYMLATKIKDDAKRTKKAEEIAEKLLSKKFFPNHGQFINAETADKDLELNIETLDRTDDLWKMIWEYYVRAELQMNIAIAPDQIKVKLLESSAESIITPESAKALA